MGFDAETTNESTQEGLEPQEAVTDVGESPDVASADPPGEEQAPAEEIVVSFEGDPAPPQEEKEAPKWVKELRKSHKEQQRKIKELERELQAKASPEPAKDVVGDEPTLEGLDYDVDRYKSELLAWNERQRKAEQAEAEKRKQADQADQAWRERVEAYNKLKSELKVPDFDEVEAAVTHALSQTQTGIIVQYASNPASLMLALDNNPSKLQELAEIKDPILFAYAVRDLEKKVTITKRTPPPPEPKVAPTGAASGTMESTLDRLREEASKTGDFTKVLQYKAQMRSKQAS